MNVTQLSPAERETTITMTDEDETVTVWTAQRRQLTRLRRHPAFTETATGFHGSTEWAQFTITASDFTVAGGAKRKREMSEEQKKAAADRLRNSRQK